MNQIPTIPEILEKATWVMIREKGCDHPLERAVEVDTDDELVWIRKAQKHDQLYAVKPNGTNWCCAKCGTMALTASIAHTVLDGFFSCSGSGEVSYEEAPYCPKCEEKPSFYGSPAYS